jgi:hypothetical protein
MKLKNRIMSWILHPSAYLVWHALGNPDEWEDDSADKSSGKVYTIRHLPTGYRLWTANGRMFLDGWSEWEGSIGLIDRWFLWDRAYAITKKMKNKTGKRARLFVLMTQLTGKP